MLRAAPDTVSPAGVVCVYVCGPCAGMRSLGPSLCGNEGWLSLPGPPSPAASGQNLLDTLMPVVIMVVSNPCFQDLPSFGCTAEAFRAALGLCYDLEVWVGFRIVSKWERCSEMSLKYQIIDREKVAFAGKKG